MFFLWGEIVCQEADGWADGRITHLLKQNDMAHCRLSVEIWCLFRIFKENILIFFPVSKKHRLIYCLEWNKSLEPDSLGSFLLHNFFGYIIVYPISKLNRIYFFELAVTRNSRSRLRTHNKIEEHITKSVMIKT